MISARSFIQAVKILGPKRLPCPMPVSLEMDSELTVRIKFCLSTELLNLHAGVYYLKMMQSNQEGLPLCHIFLTLLKEYYVELSRKLLKNHKKSLNCACWLFFNASKILFVSSKNAVLVPLPFINPCWCL
jgi:hypothetical protein